MADNTSRLASGLRLELGTEGRWSPCVQDAEARPLGIENLEGAHVVEGADETSPAH